MSKRESILAAMATLLAVKRNVPLGEIGSDLVFRTLHDGDLEAGEELWNPPTFEFTASPALTIVVRKSEGVDLDAALAAEIDAAVATLAGAGSLGGLVTAIRPRPANMAPRELWGAEDMKGAELTIELDYWTDSSAG